MMLLTDQSMVTEEIEQMEKTLLKDNEGDQMLLIDFDASICKDPETYVSISHGIVDSSPEFPPGMFSADLLSLDLSTIIVTPPGDVPAGIDEDGDKSLNLPTITVTPPHNVSAAFDTKSVNQPTITVAHLAETSLPDTNATETDKPEKPKRAVLPDRVITKAGLAKLASDEGKVSRNVSTSGTVTHLVEDNAGNTFVVANKQAGKKIISICSCSPDGVCHSFHVMAVEYFNTGITKAPCLIPSKVNMRKKSSLQSKKSTKTFGRKKPDKIAF